MYYYLDKLKNNMYITRIFKYLYRMYFHNKSFTFFNIIVEYKFQNQNKLTG